MHCFGGTGGSPRDLDSELNGTFGELGGDINVAYFYDDWIVGVIGLNGHTAPIPEPEAYAPLLAGLSLLWYRSRRTR